MKFLKFLAAALLLPALSSAQIKISNLPGVPPLTGTEQFPCSVGTTTTYKCTATQIHDFVNSNYVDLCRQTGVDPTGATDSDLAVQTVFAAMVNSGKTLYVNCPVKFTIGSDPTKTVFIGNGTDVQFGPAGIFIVDNNYIAAFVMLGTLGSRWVDAKFEYVGSQPVASNTALGGALNDGRMKTYATTVLGNTFSGSGSTLYTSPTNATCVLRIMGATRINMIRPKFYVPDGVGASSYMPCAVEIAPIWTPGSLVTNNNQIQNSSTSIVTQDVNFYDSVLDGFLMGFVGTGNLRLINPKFMRYSDLQDSAGANVGGVGTWFAPPHAVYMLAGDPSYGASIHITNGLDTGAFIGNRRTSGSGWALSLKIDISNGGTVDGWATYRPDGCMDLINNYNNQTGGSVRNMTCVFNSNTAGSDGGHWPAVRFPGAYNEQTATFDNIVMIDTAVAPFMFPFSGPQNSSASADSNNNMSFTNMKVFLNDWPTGATWYVGPTIGGSNINFQMEVYFANCNSDQQSRGILANQGPDTATNSNFDYKIYGWRQFTPTFTSLTATGGLLSATWGHTTGTYTATFSDGEVRYVTFTSGNATPGAWAALTGTATTAAAGTGTVATITYAGGNGGPQATVGTPVTIAGVTPTGYNGTYTVTASTPGTVSYANTTTGAQTVAGTILPFNQISVTGALNANYAGYKLRATLGQNGTARGTKAHVVDVTNGWEEVIDNGIQVEYFTQTWTGTPAAGATYALPMAFPSTMAIDRWTWFPTVAFTGPTSINVGLSGGSATAFVSGAPITTGSPFYAPLAPVLSNGGNILLTGVGGSFSGTGTVSFSARGMQMTGTN